MSHNEATHRDAETAIDEGADVVLVVEKHRFYCRRQVLIQKSPYFAAMFGSEMIESHSGIVEIQEVSAASMKVLMQYMKTGTLNFNVENVGKLLQAAAMLQFDEVKDACVDQLSAILRASNCLGIMFLADRFGLSNLHLQAKHIALWDFELVQEKTELINIPCHCLIEYLSHDSLRTPSELHVFLVIARWISYDRPNRLQFFEELLWVVRFSEATYKEVKEMARNELVKQCAAVHRIVHEIWRAKLDRRRQGQPSSTSSPQLTTPPSDVSPAESVDSLSAARTDHLQSCQKNGTERKPPLVDHKDDAEEAALVDDLGACAYSERAEAPSLATAPGEIVMEDLRPERVTALRLLMARPRCIPMVPAVIGYLPPKVDEKSSVPVLAIYTASDHTVRTLVEITKATQGNRVALGFKACAVGNTIYVVGGEFLYGHNNWNMAVWRFNVFSKLWLFVCNMRNPRRHHTLCVLDNVIYIIGGIGRFRIPLNTAETLCTESCNWSDIKPLPSAVYSAASVGYDGKVYVLETNVYRYDPQHSLWLHLNRCRLPNEMSFHSALPHANGIYLVGSNSKKLVLFTPNSGNVDKCHEIVGEFQTMSENACIIDDVVYSFGSNKLLVVEPFNVATRQREMMRVPFYNGHLHGANLHYGCFSLPYYGSVS